MSVSTLDPHAALVVVDLQRGVLAVPTEPHPSTEVLARSVRLAEAFRAAGHLVVLVRVSFRPDGSDAPPGRTEARTSAVARPDGWDELAEDLHRHTLERIVPRLGETGSTTEVLALTT